jgi:hypothetical protein
MFLNLNQDDEEADARNDEHEGGENEEDDARNVEHEEDEGNIEHALVGTLSTSQVRRGRGLNKLPRDCNTGLVRSRTLSNLGLAFRNFESRMWSQYG